MREIKFRVWDVSHEIYLDPKDYYLLNGQESKGAFGVMCRDFNNYSEGEYFYFPDQVLEQYTGLKDKNGKEIYEGDIIKIQDPYNGCWSTNGAEVIFSNDYVGGWVISNEKHNLNLGTRQNRIKIIGNIHDNPELLEKENV